MRLLLIADVHANWDALLALQRAEPQPDGILFAGDAVGYGPDPAPCVRWLRAQATFAVRGNHDEFFAQGQLVGVPTELAEAAGDTIAYARRFFSANLVSDLQRWPTAGTCTLGGAAFYVTHGTPSDPLGGRLNPAMCPEAELHWLFDDVPGEVIVLGHTHVPALRRFGTKLIVNPGSLGQPRYGVPDATYAVWDDGRVQIKHLHYDHGAVAQKVQLMRLNADITQQLIQILETGLIEA